MAALEFSYPVSIITKCNQRISDKTSQQHVIQLCKNKDEEEKHCVVP